jgi:hypothetical protein
VIHDRFRADPAQPVIQQAIHALSGNTHSTKAHSSSFND